MKGRVSAKASNWLHAKARSVRHGHRPQTMFIGIVSGLFSTIVLGLWLSGHLGDAYNASLRFSENRLLDAGFGVDHIEISGARRASEAEVRRVLGVETGELLLSIDLDAARVRVESLSWVRQASVKRQMPNRISVIITERTPFAIWQQKDGLMVVNAAGKRIDLAGKQSYPDLPLIVGDGATKEAARLFSNLNTRKAYADKIHSLIRVSERRWNVRFVSGSEILLPANGWPKTLDRIAQSDDLLAMLDLPHILLDARDHGHLSVRRKTGPTGGARNLT